MWDNYSGIFQSHGAYGIVEGEFCLSLLLGCFHLKRKIIWTKLPWLWVQNISFRECSSLSRNTTFQPLGCVSVLFVSPRDITSCTEAWTWSFWKKNLPSRSTTYDVWSWGGLCIPDTQWGCFIFTRFTPKLSSFVSKYTIPWGGLCMEFILILRFQCFWHRWTTVEHHLEKNHAKSWDVPAWSTGEDFSHQQ